MLNKPQVILTLIFIATLIALPVQAQQLVGTVPVDINPVAVGVNPATNLIYIANQDTADVTVINGINLHTSSVLVESGPFAVVVNSATNKIYVGNQGAGTVTVIDGATNDTRTVLVGVYLIAMAVNPVTNKIYVVDFNTGDLVIIDGQTLQTTPVTVGYAPYAVAVNTVTNKIYVANYCGSDPNCSANNDGTVTVIDGNTLQTATVTVGIGPDDIAVNPLTNEIYVANQESATVTAIDGATNNTSTVPVGNQPDVVVVNPVTNLIYVANQGDGTVTVINGANNQTTLVSGIPDPTAAGVDTATNKIYLTDQNFQKVTMIDGNTNNTIPVTVGNYPAAVGVDTVTNRIYVPNSGDGTVSVIAGASAAAVQFVPLTPCRLFDTRSGNPIQGGTSQSFSLPQEGACGATIPPGATAYSLNVTVVPRGRLGYLTIWPTGEDQPTVSTLNSTDGRIKANAAVVPAGYQGAVSVYVSDTSDVILDINGYFIAPGSQTLQFYPLTPCRVVDTRNGSTVPPQLGPPSMGNRQTRTFQVLTYSPCLQGLPHQPVAYSFNATVVPSPAGQPLGYLTLWPSNDGQPGVSTLNNPTATVVANAAIVPANPQNGDIDAYTFNSTDLILDINGYFALPASNGYNMYPAAPCRVLDTRANNGPPFMGTITVNVTSSQCSPPSTAQAYIFNATVVPPAQLGYLSLWPHGESMPAVSTLNAYDGFITSNMAIVPTTDGSIDAYASDLTQLILDISGYFAP